jgi:hypothetical protein
MIMKLPIIAGLAIRPAQRAASRRASPRERADRTDCASKVAMIYRRTVTGEMVSAFSWRRLRLSPEIVGGDCNNGDVMETLLDPRQAMVACLDQWRHAVIDCDDAGLPDEVRDIESVSRMLHSVMLDAVAELESRNIAVAAGFRNTKQLLAGMLNLSATEAGARVTHAGLLGPRRTLGGAALTPLLPETAAALAAGQIGPAQVRVITEPIRRSYTTSHGWRGGS